MKLTSIIFLGRYAMNEYLIGNEDITFGSTKKCLHLAKIIYFGICLICIMILISSCVSLPRGTGLSKAIPAEKTIDNKVWLSKVEVSDPTVEDKSLIEDSLTIHILQYIEDGKYARDVNLLPGKVSENDLIFQFQFDKYLQKRSPHPAYFPAAILTATFYIWFGGPIFVDTSEISGSLIVKDSSGSIVTKESSQVSEEHNVSLWSPQYALPSGIDARTQIIKTLLSKEWNKD